MTVSFWHYVKRFWKYSEKGVRDPLLAWHYLINGNRKAAQLQVKRVVEALGYKAQDAELYYNNPGLRELQLDISEALKGTGFSGVGTAGEDFYVMLRLLRPKIVVETGVAAGVSTTFILKALEDNNEGTLCSIDYSLSEQEYAAAVQAGLETAFPLPEGKQTGFAIPEKLKGRWVLHLGKSKEILPNLLNELGSIDVFLHDSDHSYENMMFEYCATWDYLPEGGLLLSHDTDLNSAFNDFSKKVNVKPIELYFRGGLGAIIK